jgi:hypothetical protein
MIRSAFVLVLTTLRRSRRRAVAASASCAAIALAVACASAPSDNRIGINAPDQSQFEGDLGGGTFRVGDFMTHKCGSLDCHGNAQRNFVIYGCEGLRLDPDDAGLLPGCRRMITGGKDTTKVEYDTTYRSLVSLEPVVMSAVISGKGQHPELLTFIRKARGVESHKGGALVTPGDDQDVCMTSWLQGQTNTDACRNAVLGAPDAGPEGGP